MLKVGFRDYTEMIREVVIVEGWFQRSHRYDKRGSHQKLNSHYNLYFKGLAKFEAT